MKQQQWLELSCVLVLTGVVVEQTRDRQSTNVSVATTVEPTIKCSEGRKKEEINV